MNIKKRKRNKRTMGDKVHSREGNSPDRKLRSLNYNEVKEGIKKLR